MYSVKNQTSRNNQKSLEKVTNNSKLDKSCENYNIEIGQNA